MPAYAVEIYAAGKHFSSFDDYKKGQESTPAQAQTDSLGLISKEEQQQLNKIGYNQGVAHTVVDFQQNWQNPQPRFIVNSKELQEAIRETIGDNRKAALLISDPKKMRILSLVSPQGGQSAGSIDNSQKQ